MDNEGGENAATASCRLLFAACGLQQTTTWKTKRIGPRDGLRLVAVCSCCSKFAAGEKVSLKEKIPRRKTQKQRKTFWKNTNLAYLGAGAFGTIYAFGSRAMKIHRLRKETETCEDWKREYKLQTRAHRLCNRPLQLMNVYIVQPFGFHYGAWDTDKKTLRQTNSHVGATSCYFTMERVEGRLPASPTKEHTFQSIVPGFRAKYLLPPYLFLGALQYQLSPDSNAITLDMMSGAELIEFPRESIAYCNVIQNSIAYRYLQSITHAFFLLVEKGFVPRDIEFLFDSQGHVAIIDFNEVRTYAPSSIPIGEIAHVYIDLCGARRKSDRNPFFPADEPTPQWKFLCNPQTSPQAFCELLESFESNSWQQQIMQHVLSYICDNLVVPDVHDWNWKPVTPIFSHTGATRDFDYKFQEYIINNLCDLSVRRGLFNSTAHEGLKGVPYRDLLVFFTDILKETPQTDSEDLWESPFWKI